MSVQLSTHQPEPDGTGASSSAGGDDVELVLTVAAVARRLGVAPATLRTWARRYGLGPSGHESGTHRRYTELDLARLQAMRRLTLAGMPAADAARSVLSTDPSTQTGTRTPAQRNALTATDALGPPPAGTPVQRDLVRAANGLVAATVSDLIRRSLATNGALATWRELVEPVLDAAGRRWPEAADCAAAERLITYAADTAFRDYAARLAEPVGRRPLLFGCPPGEHHLLPLSVLAAMLADHHVAVRNLGPSVPADALAAAVRRTGAAAVLLWAESMATADPAVLTALPVTRPRVEVITAGPGWQAVALPRRARHIRSLDGAVSALLHAVSS
ncbi:MerR family transcriptional regulator [Fodinicola acaciae]|uniref:MerR family transcriptional regulator n=1 Tax=Fodinicola acaciae TaxID=2681555 RepID=UPI0013D34F8C|nr:MerR family transcriptional regulator [Fodinicola acaciae]